MRRRHLAAVALCALLVSACGGPGRQAVAGAGSSPRPAAPSGVVTVFAAASLTDAFQAAGRRFEQANPGVEVVLNLASSSTLATQIVAGAPADVFASADRAQMDAVANAGLVTGGPTDFARNRLQIAVEAGNPRQVTGLDDLARDDLTVVLAADAVPAGEYARAALDAQDIDVSPASLEPDVRAVLARVAMGEADAGIVYASDIAAAGGDVIGVPIPAEQNVAAVYPIATLVDAPNPDVADAFVAFVTSGAGAAVLTDAGFAAP